MGAESRPRRGSSFHVADAARRFIEISDAGRFQYRRRRRENFYDVIFTAMPATLTAFSQMSFDWRAEGALPAALRGRHYRDAAWTRRRRRDAADDYARERPRRHVAHRRDAPPRWSGSSPISGSKDIYLPPRYGC